MRIENAWRYNTLATSLVLMGVIIFLQTIRLNLIPEGKAIRQEGDDIYRGVLLDIDAPRGHIYDRTGHLLAGNKIVYEVGVELEYVKDAGTIAQVLNAVLGMDYGEAYEIASIPYNKDEAIYAVVERGVPADKAAFIQAYLEQWAQDKENGVDTLGNLDGLVIFPYLHRDYPEGELASPVIGFVAFDEEGYEEVGYYGVEEEYNDDLAGDKQQIWVPFNPNDVTETPDSPNGVSLVLTLDREIQLMVEEMVDKAIEDYSALSATIIVMNPENGEIYAMSSTPHLDLNEYWELTEVYPPEIPFNRGVSQAFEPGSVFKIFTMAAALDTGTVTPKTKFNDTGSIEIGGITIKNWNEDAWWEQDMIGCLRHSLNVCLAWVGKQLESDLFYQYMNAFGFGYLTGVDIAWEATGRLKEPGDRDWYPSDLGTNTFGQGISVTPIQLIMAASAVANDGKMMVPHVVRSIINNKTQYNVHPQVAGQPISVETAHTLTDMLATSLEKEASGALVSGYRLAGKTGTAQIPMGEAGYTKEKTNASFIGWGPVDDPKFLVYVWLEEPSPIWGSQTAAPVFSEVVKRLVVLLNIPPDNIRIAMSE
ncbi:MAG: penicillin-binding protein 2 [Anaerolineales bacterium]|jgi:cell division protein FtsI/penicillin-binding protein 2